MSQDGIVADQYTFSALFASLESSHEWARAAKLVHEMHARGVVGAPRMYHRAVAPLAEAQHWVSAETRGARVCSSCVAGVQVSCVCFQLHARVIIMRKSLECRWHVVGDVQQEKQS